MTLCPWARHFNLLAPGECPCTYCKSLWIRASAKWLNVNVDQTKKGKGKSDCSLVGEFRRCNERERWNKKTFHLKGSFFSVKIPFILPGTYICLGETIQSQFPAWGVIRNVSYWFPLADLRTGKLLCSRGLRVTHRLQPWMLKHHEPFQSPPLLTQCLYQYP